VRAPAYKQEKARCASRASPRNGPRLAGGLEGLSCYVLGDPIE
jgi:hypothetical protein